MKTISIQLRLKHLAVAFFCAVVLVAFSALTDAQSSQTGDQFSQQQQLAAGDGAAFDQFGAAVAMSGDTAVVGAPYDTVGANFHQGSVYVFIRSGSTWTQQAQLFADDGAAGDEFGWSVAIDGDTIVIGADADDVFANTDQGSVYVFVRSGTTWTQQAHLFASDGSARDRDFFGNSVAVQGDTAIVGAFLNDSFNVNQGSAYVFVRSGTTWTLQQHLFAADGIIAQEFGSAVALNGDTAAVGAWSDTIAGNIQEGSTYVFVRAGTTWTQQAKLTAVDGHAQDFFGGSVAISADTILVGSDWHDVGANGNQGAAYVFVRSGTSWSQQQQLTASDGAASDEFGHAVALLGDTAVVGAWMHDVNAALDEGSAYIFARSGATWTQQQALTAADGAAGDQFGTSVALTGNTLIAGAWMDNAGANTEQGTATIFTQPTATLHVASVAPRYEPQSGRNRVGARVTIRDAANVPISGA
ncbi:MAG: FG-GAP repeat protein, partial [Limisphaerales bacterium]